MRCSMFRRVAGDAPALISSGRGARAVRRARAWGAEGAEIRRSASGEPGNGGARADLLAGRSALLAGMPRHPKAAHLIAQAAIKKTASSGTPRGRTPDCERPLGAVAVPRCQGHTDFWASH